MNDETQNDNVVRLPLWRECVKEMLANGVNHGDVFPSKYFEDWLRVPPDSMRFGLDISNIRRVLEQNGYYLSGRGQKGEQFVILPPKANTSVMHAYSRSATDALKRGVILGTNTRIDLLGAEDRRRHEAMLEKMATKLALVHHSQRISKIATVAQILEKSA